MQDRKVELLAPAGSPEAFYGAIHAGADAVYLGGNRFGARAYADNFSEAELLSCIRYAHLFGRKVYLTVNTLFKEAELAELYDYLLPLYQGGLDGVIIQDIGVFTYIREYFPDLELHVSTQMTITGKYGADMLKKMGACRVVPARELSLNEIKEMKEATGLEIETFVHGAMCYCYSGQCLFSSILGGRSGNRGRCAQPCRLPYRVKSNRGTTEELFPLSLKDMCTIEYLPELIEAGIDSFKIEGRMKKPEYAAGVTAIYRKYIDRYYQAKNKPFTVQKEDLDKLSKLYIRSERQDGYYHKHNGKDMITLTNPAYSGSDEALLTEIRRQYLEKAPKYPISIYGNFVVEDEASVTLMMEGISVTVIGEIVQHAQKQPITRENIEKQLKKLGDSVFCAEHTEITLSDEAFYPLKAINQLRRMAVVRLEEALIQRNRLPLNRSNAKPAQNNRVDEEYSLYAMSSKKQDYKGLAISIRTLEQLKAVEEFCERCGHKLNGIIRIYVDGDLLISQKELVLNLLNPAQHIVISLPSILRNKDEGYLEDLLALAVKYHALIKGFRLGSMEALGFLKEHNYSGSIFGDSGFYIWNKQCRDEWSGVLDAYCLPLELKSGEQRALLANSIPFEKIFYGRIPMMITANCVARTTGGCRKETNEREVQLIDRYHKQFPVVLNCTHCMNIIYNSVPLSLHGEWGKWQKSAIMRLDFTIETRQECREILEFFYNVYTASDCEQIKTYQPPYKEYTTGHEKRGVE